MKKSLIILLAIISIPFCISRSENFPSLETIPSGDFAAYFTHIKSDLPFEQIDRNGKYADIVVRFPDGKKFIFWRGFSFHPFLAVGNHVEKVPVIVQRVGNGLEDTPGDRVNAHSFVKLVENSANRIVVEWRYQPELSGIQPITGVTAQNVVQETFTITPDGHVSRVVRQGKNDPDAQQWNDESAWTTQQFSLTGKGIANVATVDAKAYNRKEKIALNPIKNVSFPQTPAISIKFDEGEGYTVEESATKRKYEIQGNKNQWKKGVSGSGWEFDGQTNKISVPDIKVNSTGLTIDVWVAPSAYSYNCVPIVMNDSGTGDSGFLLGTDQNGRVNLHFKTTAGWNDLCNTANCSLELARWNHITAVIDGKAHTAAIYLNGKRQANITFYGAPVYKDSLPLTIGRGIDAKTALPAGSTSNGLANASYPSPTVFTGIIDELNIFAHAFTEKQIRDIHTAYGDDANPNPDVTLHALPELPETNGFQAIYTNLDRWSTNWGKALRLSDNSDIVTGFEGKPYKYVFWAGVQYMMSLVNEAGNWLTNSFNESHQLLGEGCEEPMSDKEIAAGSVSIVHDTPARKLIKWRYRLETVTHKTPSLDSNTGWGDYCDWYYWIYPDGVTVKNMILYSTGDTWNRMDWQESIIINGAGESPQDNIDPHETVIFSTLDGATAKVSWEPNAKTENAGSSVGNDDNRILLVNLLGNYDPYEIVLSNRQNKLFGNNDSWTWWNHWPIATVNSWGRTTSIPDRVSHTSVANYDPGYYKFNQSGPIPIDERLMMEGMTDGGISATYPLAKSWNNPAPIHVTAGVGDAAYDQAQRAYVVTNGAAVGEAIKIKFSIDATPERPLQNVAFVVGKWPSRMMQAELKIDGDMAGDYSQGVEIATDGTYQLVIFANFQATGKTDFEILSDY
ncbi:MAG: LamG domain-containing protein [Tannerellaceae bacterium]|jgi:hypothetical protein|nr:LamG domain-containing protein [Tannerellaceae bacterium]